MQCTGRWMFSALLLAAPVLIAQTVPDQTVSPPAATTTTPTRDSTKVQKQQPPPLVLPPMPSGPLSQMPMDQIPPMAAKVKFQGGLLEISAQNSTLGEILRDVRKLTGASIDFPPGSSGMNERVVTHLGPGAPRDVLDVLLNGSSFNYVMVGSSSDPGAVSSVILSAKPSASGETAANARQPGQPMLPAGIPPRAFDTSGPHIGLPGNPQPANADAQDSNDDQEAAADDTADDQSQPVQAQPDTTDAETQGQGQGQGQGQPQPDANQPNAGPKTPEQILDLLRRQQQPGSMVPPQQQPPQPQPPPPQQ
jgi:hypothetical protein